MKNVIWLIGSNAVGKTTQSIAIHDYYNDLPDKRDYTASFIWCKDYNLRGTKTSLTLYKNSIHVGRIQKNNCCGTDVLGKKEMIVSGFKLAYGLKQPNIVLDGIMATGTWIEFIKAKPCNLILILLSFKTLEENIERIKQRREGKEVDEKTRLNVLGKIKGFNSLYKRMQPYADKSIKLNAAKSKEYITERIVTTLI